MLDERPAPPALSGFLHKRGHGWHGVGRMGTSWKRRFWWLSEGVLEYYVDDTPGLQPLGRLLLLGATLRRVDADAWVEAAKAGEKRIAWALTMNTAASGVAHAAKGAHRRLHDTYMMGSLELEEGHRWMDALQEHIAHVSGSPAGASSTGGAGADGDVHVPQWLQDGGGVALRDHEVVLRSTRTGAAILTFSVSSPHDMPEWLRAAEESLDAMPPDAAQSDFVLESAVTGARMYQFQQNDDMPEWLAAATSALEESLAIADDQDQEALEAAAAAASARSSAGETEIISFCIGKAKAQVARLRVDPSYGVSLEGLSTRQPLHAWAFHELGRVVQHGMTILVELRASMPPSAPAEHAANAASDASNAWLTLNGATPGRVAELRRRIAAAASLDLEESRDSTGTASATSMSRRSDFD